MHFGLVHDHDLPLVRSARHWVRAFSVLPGWHQEYPKAPEPLSEPVPVDNTSGFQGLMGWYPRRDRRDLIGESMAVVNSDGGLDRNSGQMIVQQRLLYRRSGCR
jgi:hypothetical protein